MSSAQAFKDAAAKRRKTTVVEIDGLGPVTLRALSAGDAQRFQSDVKKAKTAGDNEEELAFPLIARSWIGDDGELWFPEEEGVAVARSLDPETYNLIATAVLKLNGLSVDAVDDAAKNSELTRDDSMRIHSRGNSVTPVLT